MSEELLTIRLRSLTCFQNDEEKFDYIFIIYNCNKIWPVDKKHEDVPVGSYKLGIYIPDVKANSEMVLEIWDHDKLTQNDLLGKMHMIPDQTGGPYTVDMKPTHDSDTARYMIEWQILWQDQVDD